MPKNEALLAQVTGGEFNVFNDYQNLRSYIYIEGASLEGTNYDISGILAKDCNISFRNVFIRGSNDYAPKIISRLPMSKEFEPQFLINSTPPLRQILLGSENKKVFSTE